MMILATFQCDDNLLQLNVTKTKELCIDFWQQQTPPKHVCINGEEVVRDDIYKYKCIVIDSKLKWNENTESMMKKKCIQRCTVSGSSRCLESVRIFF